MLPFKHELAKPYHDRLGEEEMEASWHLVEPDGTRLKKRPAVVALLGHIHATRWIVRGAEKLRLGWLLVLGNEFFNRTRKHLGKVVPKVEPPVRWP